MFFFIFVNSMCYLHNSYEFGRASYFSRNLFKLVQRVTNILIISTSMTEIKELK